MRGQSHMKQLLLVLGAILLLIILVARSGPRDFSPPQSFPVLEPEDVQPSPEVESETATFGSGCFWCTEAVFRRVKGVRSAVSGFSGGDVANPTYKQVCLGTTGHAEVVQVVFDPKVVSYPQLLEVFWRSHDPTTVDRQGNDKGPQYRSVILFHSDRQRALAERYKRKIDAAEVYPDPLVTEIVPFTVFYAASDDQQDYYTRNSRQPYCRAVIGQKLNKLKAIFGDRLLTVGV
jgi:peptide-methionine (S)-S-oxide reductase